MKKSKFVPELTDEEHAQAAYLPKMFIESFYAGCEELPSDILEKLKNDCYALGIDESEFRSYELVARGLRDCQKNYLPHLLTVNQRCQRLAAVSELAKELHKKLTEVDPDDQGYLFLNSEDPFKKRFVYNPQSSGKYPSLEIYLNDYWDGIKSIAVISEKRKKEISTMKSLGRKSTIVAYADIIQFMDRLTPAIGMVARGGKFEKVCKAIFVAAAIPSEPEGVIKFLLERRKKSS